MAARTLPQEKGQGAESLKWGKFKKNGLVTHIRGCYP